MKLLALILLHHHILLLMVIVTLSLSYCLSAARTRSNELHPVILIPGAGGNQLEARLAAGYRPSSLLCRVSPLVRREGGWFRLWFDPTVVLVPLTKCFAERMMLYYDAGVDDYRNAPGVETRVPDFGSTEGLRYLDPHLKHITDYMATLVTTLEKAGYEDGRNLFGAPYDFRYGLAAPGHPSKVGTTYLKDLKRLIEATCASNGGKPVILLAHSLGGLYALQLLIRNSLSWRRAYVKHLVTLSTPWAGTVQQMLTFASGNTLGVPLVDPLIVRGEQRSSESNLWLLPSPKFFGNTTLVVSRSRNRSYSSMQLPKFLEDIGFSEGVEPYKTRIRPLVERLVKPGIPVTCMVGTGLDTPERLVYGEGGFDAGPDNVVYGDGDGTVNLLSLLALQSECSNSSSKVLKVVRLPKVSHSSILSDSSALIEIVDAIGSINSNIMSYQY